MSGTGFALYAKPGNSVSPHWRRYSKTNAGWMNYIDRVDRFYTLHHNKNCERTYLAVKRLPEEKQNRVGQFKIPPADAF